MPNNAFDALRHSRSFLVGFLVRPCCSIPAALSLLGLSGAGVAAVLAPWHTAFLALAAAFFAVSFYMNFIRNRNRAGMIVWALSVLLAAGILLGPTFAKGRSNPSPAPAANIQDMKKIEYQIERMACDACARRLHGKLAKTPGVTEASVSFKEKRATVTYEPEQLSPGQIRQQIEATGFRATGER